MRNELGRFVVGASGNPSGRPAGIKSFNAFAREITLEGRELIQFWYDMMKGRVPGAKASDKNRASELLAERAFGKPMDIVATLDVSGDDQAADTVRQMAIDALTSLAILPPRSDVIEGTRAESPQLPGDKAPSIPALSDASEG